MKTTARYVKQRGDASVHARPVVRWHRDGTIEIDIHGALDCEMHFRILLSENEAAQLADMLNARRNRATEPEAARATADQSEPRLDRRAQVGNTRFGVGVHWSTVIGAAQRYHDFMNTPEKESERTKNARALMDVLTANGTADHRDSVIEASAAICQRLATEALDNPNVHKDSRTVVHAALLVAATEIRNLKAPRSGNV